MKIHEYQAKELFRSFQVPILQGFVAKTPEEAKAAFEKLGGALAVIKAQVHAGGRGKGTFIEVPSQRGVQLTKS
ncbi:MAG: ATP-grasp domain-containing protein, partial [Pirellula sp.]